MRYALRSLLLLAACAAPLAAQAAPRKPQGAYFSPKGGGARAIAETLEEARETVDIAMYSISPEGQIFKALEAAIGRGVKVRMVLHKATSSNKELAQRFAELGVEVSGVGPTMHHKFAIIDGKTLITGSANWSLAADQRFNEVTLILRRSKSLKEAFEREFARLHAQARSVSKSGEVGPEPEAPKDLAGEPEGRDYGVWFTSENDGDRTRVVADQLIKAIGRAERRIDIMVAHFNYGAITEALAAVIKARNTNKDTSDDLEVRILLDRGEFDDSKSEAKALEAAGATVRYKVYSLGFFFPRAQLMHHKTLLVDGRWLLTGSYNWSETAEHTNYENLLVIDAESSPKELASLVEDFSKEFEELWEMGRLALPSFLEAVLSKKGQKGYRSVVPIHFDRPYWDTVMAMSRDELEPVMEVARKAGLEGAEQESYLSKNTGKPLPFVRGRLCPNLDEAIEAARAALKESEAKGKGKGSKDKDAKDKDDEASSKDKGSAKGKGKSKGD